MGRPRIPRPPTPGGTVGTGTIVIPSRLTEEERATLKPVKFLGESEFLADTREEELALYLKKATSSLPEAERRLLEACLGEGKPLRQASADLGLDLTQAAEILERWLLALRQLTIHPALSEM